MKLPLTGIKIASQYLSVSDLSKGMANLHCFPCIWAFVTKKTSATFLRGHIEGLLLSSNLYFLQSTANVLLGLNKMSNFLGNFEIP